MEAQLPVLFIENINNKLNADMFLHVVNPPLKYWDEVTNEVFLVKSHNNIEFKAQIVDYSKALVIEYSESILLMATGKTWEQLRAQWGPDKKIALCVMKKITD